MIPSYALRDPKGWGGDPKRGAALGRPNVAGSADYAGKLVLREVHLDAGGYDENGTYWGLSATSRLYWYASADEGQTIEGNLWASDRDAAKLKVLDKYPKARFFR